MVDGRPLDSKGLALYKTEAYFWSHRLLFQRLLTRHLLAYVRQASPLRTVVGSGPESVGVCAGNADELACCVQCASLDSQLMLHCPHICQPFDLPLLVYTSDKVTPPPIGWARAALSSKFKAHVSAQKHVHNVDLACLYGASSCPLFPCTHGNIGGMRALCKRSQGYAHNC